MDIKYPIENEYMKCVLQINGFNGPRPRVRVQPLGRVRGRDIQYKKTNGWEFVQWQVDLLPCQNLTNHDQ